MKEEQLLKIIGDVGPGAKDALDSWVSLQWANFYGDCIFGAIAFILIGAFCYFFIKYIKRDDD